MRPYPCNVCPPGTSVGNLCEPCFRRHVEDLNGRVIFLESQLELAELALFQLNQLVEQLQAERVSSRKAG